MPSNEVMKKFAKGRLHSGSAHGPVVASVKQAIAIAASERDAERANGGDYPDHAAKRSKREGKDSR